jgi:hypothetical protein
MVGTDGDRSPAWNLRSAFLNAEELIPRHLLPTIDNGIDDHACIAVAGDRPGLRCGPRNPLYS